MKNLLKVLFSIVLVNLLFIKTPIVEAGSGVSCKVHGFLVNSNYQLPYKNDGTEISSSNGKVKPGDWVSLSFEIKNYTEQERIELQKVYITQMAGVKEPIDIIEVRPHNGNCSVDNTNKSVFCNTNYSFPREAFYPIEFLIKINKPTTLPKITSSLFSIETTGGSASCASYINIQEEGQKNPISWSTPYAEIKAEDFYIRVGDKKYYGIEPIRISSDPGTERTTLESIWNENGVEMRMFMYFQEVSANVWEMYDLRTYNGEQQGDWIYYKDSSGNKPTGTDGYANYQDKRTFVPTDGRNAIIYCEKCSIRAFLKNTTPITADYAIDFLIGLPEGKIITITNQPLTGYGVNSVLKDKGGNIVKDQGDFSYVWTVDNKEVLYITSIPVEYDNGCAYGINKPCPNSNVQMRGLRAGKTNVNLSVVRKSDNKLIASNSFPVIVNNFSPTPTPFNCINRGEAVKVGSTKTCCQGTALIKPDGDRNDIIGICMQECSKDSDCFNGEICEKQTYSSSLACVTGNRDNEAVNQLKNEVKQLKQEMENQKVQQNKLMEMLEAIKQFLKNIFG